MTHTVRLDADLHKEVKEVAGRERRTVADTARLLLGSGIARYRQTGEVFGAASGRGELVLFPLPSPSGVKS